MRFYVTFKIDARYVACVDAPTVEEALRIAPDNFYDADFGEAEEIDGRIIIVEDEDGNFVYER